MPKIDLAALPLNSGCSYPHPFKDICQGATWHALGDAAGLGDFGVNLVRLPPGKWSSQRHWHSEEDEFVMILQGELVAVEDDGDHVLRAGDYIGWKAGERGRAHHLQNRSTQDAVYLEVGSRRPGSDACDYPDIDMVARPGEDFYRHRDGTPYRQG